MKKDHKSTQLITWAKMASSPAASAAVPQVKYHTSDFLAHRHPFQSATSFETQRQRDAGKVLHGLFPGAMDTLFNSLVDPALDPMQKAIALKHLLSHSAAAEKKVLFLRAGIVPVLASLFNNKATTPSMECLSAQILRSLSVLPQGAHCVVVEGGLEGLVTSIRDRRDSAAREEARTASVEAVLQVVTCWDGREWLLGLDGAQGMQFPDRIAPTLSVEQRDVLARDACDALSSVLEHDVASPRLLKAGLHAVALVTTVPKGLQLCLIAGALRSTSDVLQRYCTEQTGENAWTSSTAPTHATDVAVVNHAVSVVYHIAMDDVGKRESLELPILRQLTHIAHAAMAVTESLFELKATIAGCSCALALSVPLKGAALTKHAIGGSSFSFLEALIRLLQHANRVYEPMMEAKKKNEAPPLEHVRLQDVQATIKGCVQGIRLICELPAARHEVHQIVSEYVLRRQIFYATPFQDEFGVLPV
jgi:hypothetical protein